MYQPILKSLLKLTSDTHSRQTRYANFNIARPVIKRKTEGGRTFTVTACQGRLSSYGEELYL